ncbi:FkbM family methyltransferase [Ferrovibrio sp.]|uniref:FkbM family methyltransferase n=1 Tax=Ferrovibrio sp. TaxID=1917215 RepID=UPI0025C0E85F|nr:FkbM family methyltransferase [Ferrovibrio sp.]MBX3456238.1 FkbM family methyltransferase [Ferrovibrio sp.]
MIPIPLALKRLVPGYTQRWRKRYAGFMAYMNREVPKLHFGETDGTPWIERAEDGLRLHGFWTEPANADAYDMLRPDLPGSLPKPHFRLVKDYINRYLFPHMRPDLKPEGFDVEQLWGFHGQHKDAIADYPDSVARERLMRAFTPKPGETFIDGGAFLGFGDIRMAREVLDCRVIAVEANRDCHALLSRNLQHNGINAVIARHNGVWKAAGSLNLETGFAQANSLVEEVHKGDRTQIVETISVDGIVAAEGLDRLSMLSLTLNGAEVEALEGAKDTLTRLRPRIRLAGWYSRGDRKISAITAEQLAAYDYDVFVGPRNNTMALPKELA